METFSLETIGKIALSVLALLVVAGLFISVFFAWSVLAGGLIILANLWFSKDGLQKMAEVVTATASMNPERQRSVAGGERRGYLLRFWLRLGITGVVLFAVIRWQLVDIFGLLLGLSIILVTTIAFSLAVVVHYLIQRSQGRR